MVVWIQNPFDNLPSEGYRKQRFWMMAEAFVRAGHEVVLWTSDFSHATKKPRKIVKPEAQKDGGFDVRLIPTKPYSKNVSWTRIRSHRNYSANWMDLAAKETRKPDVIVVSTPTLSGAEAALAIGRAAGAKVVVDVMDAWPETFERILPRCLRWLAKPFLLGMYRTSRRIYREADLVTGVCERYRELTGRSDYHLAYHGIEIDATRSSQLATRNSQLPIRLVYAGNLGKTYDLATVVEAVKANDDFELDVAGFGEFSCDCPRVRFHGYLGSDDLRKLFASSDIGIVPMRADSWVGVPYKFCDYSQDGLAIVSSLGGESSALLEKYKCGATYRAGDATSLAAAIRQTMTLERGASRTMCAAEFDARKIYDAYVKRVTG